MSRPLAGLGTDDESDLQFLKERGLSAIVSLTPNPLSPTTLDRYGFAHLHLPLEDFSAPTMEQIAEFVTWVREHLEGDGRVAVHCLMGQGRTGTMLACYLVSEGRFPEEAIREARAKLPSAIETRAQEQAVHDWWEVLQQGAQLQGTSVRWVTRPPLPFGCP